MSQIFGGCGGALRQTVSILAVLIYVYVSEMGNGLWYPFSAQLDSRFIFFTRCTMQKLLIGIIYRACTLCRKWKVVLSILGRVHIYKRSLTRNSTLYLNPVQTISMLWVLWRSHCSLPLQFWYICKSYWDLVLCICIIFSIYIVYLRLHINFRGTDPKYSSIFSFW